MAYRTSGYGSFGGGGGFGFGFALTPVVKRLLIANGIVFLATWAIGHELVFDWFAFQPRRVFTRPWGAFTYMFVHADFMHVFFNMLAIFFFGPPLESRWGGREFFKFYLVCGLGGVLLSFLFVPAAVVGASAAAYGLMLAFAMNWPDSPIYIWGILPVKAKWLVAFLFVMSLFSAFGTEMGGVAHMAHLGGLVTGFLYLKADWRTGERIEKIKRKATKARRLAIVPRDEDEETESTASPATGVWRDASQRQLLDAVDRVLDKISAEGMGALTADERRLLDEVSRRQRTN